MYQEIEGVRVWGQPLENAVKQAINCAHFGQVKKVLLMADHHYGYSQPVGGVVVYENQISPSGVGYDIACGNKAVRTNVKYKMIQDDLSVIMDEIAKEISFGIGRQNQEKVDHEMFDDSDWQVFKEIGHHEHDQLKALARKQLGTVGSGNHFVDLFVEESTDDVWIANHFGSRGFGHKTASGFLNLAKGKGFSEQIKGEKMEAAPTLFNLDSPLGDLYFRAMNLAGRYAYAGRDYVIDKVLSILQAKATYSVHNHHNFAWKETHNNNEYIVVRKGATPSAPGQLGFIGGSMGDYSVIVEGKDSDENKEAFYSTVHGAGRIMSRTEAAGKMNWKLKTRMGGKITEQQMQDAVKQFGVELRGAGTDESPFVYKKLESVLEAHKETLTVKHKLKPIGVCMAGANEHDPYKD
ncbi:RtcB family protein [Alkalihalobacillus trypoxylicola]|uniref:3'-phosphate/5'-hydroxy nucleic acid ligase n=1 Tax=Alkalihalobacillus trypoxylicola TaxID=519424 RepID=A0A162E7I2_9BACI|nr:RtcB family protein [Alkalihalobacillus trypoxylicola]KYG31965.1 RNA-splicing ligase RtcB [Alkalihalobacillus trypoxylicola]